MENSPDLFWYVCGYSVGSKHVSINIKNEAKQWIGYRLHIGMPTDYQNVLDSKRNMWRMSMLS